MKETYTVSELQTTLDALRGIFDFVRVVDPVKNVVLDFSDGILKAIADKQPCHTLWHKGQPCTNCSSLCALNGKGRKTKFEYIHNDIYNIVSKYILVDGQAFVLEIVSRISDELLLDASGQNEFLAQVKQHNSAIYTDPLTGAYNRRFLMENRHLIQKSGSFLAMADIDRFKQVNDSYGHDAGDAVLIMLVKYINSSIRSNGRDLLFRYGGDEFLLLMNGISYEVFTRRITKLLSGIRSVSFKEYTGLRVTLSIGGVSKAEKPDAPYEELIRIADQRMYEAKAAGGNCLIIAPAGEK